MPPLPQLAINFSSSKLLCFFFSLNMQTTDYDNLINLTTADDALLPPSLNGEFVGFRLSVSEKRSCKARPPPAAAVHGYEPDRKSLSWHTEFFTNDGILDAEELMMFNRGFRKKNLINNRETQTTTVPRSQSMARVPAKRIATAGESSIGNKKQRSSLSTSVRSGIVPNSSTSSSSSGSSLKNMLKASVNFLKKRVGVKNKDSSSSPDTSSKKSQANGIRPAHPGRRSMPKLPPSSDSRHSIFSPSTPPDNKSMGFYEESLKLSLQSMPFSASPATKETIFRTPVSKPSGLRLPSARFGFFDVEKKSNSSKCEEIFHTATKSTPQEDTTTSSVTGSAKKKLKSSILTPIPYLSALQTEANDKENKFSNEGRVDDLSKHLVSIDLNTDLVVDLQGKRGDLLQVCTPTDHSETTPLKQGVLAQRTPLAAHNRSLYSSISSRY